MANPGLIIALVGNKVRRSGRMRCTCICPQQDSRVRRCAAMQPPPAHSWLPLRLLLWVALTAALGSREAHLTTLMSYLSWQVDLADESRAVPEADARAYAGAPLPLLDALLLFPRLVCSCCFHIPLHGAVCRCMSPEQLVFCSVQHTTPLSRFDAVPPHSSTRSCAAAETGLLYFETSAKTNINVTQLFEEVADK